MKSLREPDYESEFDMKGRKSLGQVLKKRCIMTKTKNLKNILSHNTVCEKIGKRPSTSLL